jgi:alpha-N-arabinofuranosidase
MANPAQLINTIHSLFIAAEDKFAMTPNYHVFEMYMPHAGATSLRTEFISPRVGFSRFDSQRRETKASLWGLAGSASVKGKTITLTAVNPDHASARETEINLNGARIVSAEARVLSSNTLQIRNTFANPNALVPRNEAVTIGAGGKLVYKFAPASVTRLTLQIA